MAAFKDFVQVYVPVPEGIYMYLSIDMCDHANADNVSSSVQNSNVVPEFCSLQSDASAVHRLRPCALRM